MCTPDPAATSKTRKGLLLEDEEVYCERTLVCKTCQIGSLLRSADGDSSLADDITVERDLLVLFPTKAYKWERGKERDRGAE